MPKVQLGQWGRIYSWMRQTEPEEAFSRMENWPSERLISRNATRARTSPCYLSRIVVEYVKPTWECSSSGKVKVHWKHRHWHNRQTQNRQDKQSGVSLHLRNSICMAKYFLYWSPWVMQNRDFIHKIQIPYISFFCTFYSQLYNFEQYAKVESGGQAWWYFKKWKIRPQSSCRWEQTTWS